MAESPPDPARRIADATIHALWARHGLGAVRHIVAPGGGVRNESYVVNGELVIRFNTRDPQFAKFNNERAAYDLLASGPLPVPRVVALDESRAVVPYDYIILTRLPGAGIAAGRDTLTAEQVDHLAGAAGRALAHLHGVTLSGFAKLCDLAQPPFATWPAYFRDYVDRYLTPARDLGLLDTETLARLAAVRDQAAPLLAEVTQGVLVHADFHYENLLQVNGQLSGVLDFEWALAGDPVLDFVAAPSREAQLPGREPLFLAGYTSLRPLDGSHAARLALYHLFLALETVVTDHYHGHPAGVQAALTRLRAPLAAIE